MRSLGSGLEFSASDLSRHGACHHLTALDLCVAKGLRGAPSHHNPTVDILAQRGIEHERRYVDALKAQGLAVVDLSETSGGTPTEGALAATLDALRSGADAIVQPALRHERWFGRPDVLRRVDSPVSTFGAWSYEVIDTKLAEETRGATILQLAVYSDLLGIAQGALPERFYVVTPDPTAPVHTFRVQDYAAYARLLRARLEAATREDPTTLLGQTYPEPVEYCDVCRWWSTCDERRHDDDHVSLIAGVSRLQMRELKARGIVTLAAVGTLPDPLPFSPTRGTRETYERVREQARVQLLGRTRGEPVYEVLQPVDGEHGLARLPAPSPGDIFLDLEGDPFARAGGREYLFGLAVLGADGSCTYQRHWAYSDTEESAAFDAVVRAILAAWAANPRMHVYHYAPYEPAAMKRLMGRYASHEADIDRMLRADIFVDLYQVVRHAVRGSVEKYSIKDLEVFYGFKRELDLRDAGTSRRVVERALELGALDAITVEVRAAVEAYNRDDCISARALRDWLEGLRLQAERGGAALPRPKSPDGSAPAAVSDRARRIEPLVNALTADVPVERPQRSDEQQARWLLANLLEWHRRENKSVWWEFYRLRDLPERELLEEPAILTGLRFVKRLSLSKRGVPLDRYVFPQQDFELREHELHLRDEHATAFGDAEAVDWRQRTIDVRKRAAQADVHPSTVFLHSFVRTDDLEDAIERIAEDVVRHGLDGGTQYRVARELLLRRTPRLKGRPFQRFEDETPVGFARRIVPHMDETVLAIQGPPGAGKTHTGARMICDLVREGMRVGVTAVSHKVIHHLLEGVLEAAREESLDVSCIEKVNERSASPTAIGEVTNNGDVFARLRDGQAMVAGGTQWLWATPDAQDAVDVLFVDEAGQLSLANVVAVSHAAKSLVLLGDPQQLEQPQQGSHPEGTGVSVLEHVLGDHPTMPSDRGIFLAETWRLAPDICSFTSEMFYEGRLGSAAGCDQQRLLGMAPFEGSGLWVVPVDHEGNRNSSVEEVEAVDRIVSSLLRPGASWIDPSGSTRSMTAADVLVVAPYNAHVTLLTERLGRQGVRVGTVDKFQGQEAPVVIYSMATSTPEDAPRGMDFLYSLNRLNVATSRARCACILVASPRLFEPECRTPRQMQLANAVCRYVERATQVEGVDTSPSPRVRHPPSTTLAVAGARQPRSQATAPRRHLPTEQRRALAGGPEVLPGRDVPNSPPASPKEASTRSAAAAVGPQWYGRAVPSEDKLRAFISWFEAQISGDEKGEAQIFLDRLFQAFGQGGTLDVGGKPEFRVRKPNEDGGGVSFADYVWKPVVLVEMKKRGATLQKHRKQAFEYWTNLVPNRPRYVVLCNFDEFWIYDFDTDIDEPKDKLATKDLADRWGALAFLAPGSPEPVFNIDRVAVTRKAADVLADLLNSLLDRGVDRSLAQHFLVQNLIALFSEDIGLLPKYFYTRLVDECETPTQAFDLIGGLFDAMNKATPAGGGRFKDVPYFNGGVFAAPAHVELTTDEIKLIKNATTYDWAKVQPEIFGAIFQDSLGKGVRRALGAHFTHPVDIMKIVGPTIVEPWRERVEGAKTLTALNEALARLHSFRVLDPACGSGNFLYMAYRELKRIEARIFERQQQEFKSEAAKAAQLKLSFLSAQNFYGIDIHPLAIEIAKVTMVIARKLANDELHFTEQALPLANLNSNFQTEDALLLPSWPKVDVIIGNPPFIGAKRLKPERGPDYVKRLRRAYPTVPGMADYCVFWLRRAHEHLPACTREDSVAGRAGLVGTQNIRHNKSRVGGLDYIVSTGTIIEAVDNQPWSGEANVNVSIVNWVKTQEPGLLPKKRRLWFQVEPDPAVDHGSAFELDYRECSFINSTLTDTTDVSGALPLMCNVKPQRVFQGITPGHEGFVLKPAEQEALLAKDPSSAPVVFPYLVGRELVSGDGKPQRFVIDFGTRTVLQAQAFTEAFARVKAKVLPDRKKKAEEGKDEAGNMRSHHKQFLDRWWRLTWDREDMKQANATLKKRYIAGSRTQRWPFIFCFVSKNVLAGDKLQTFAFDDDYSFGILQAAPHLAWYAAKAARLKNEEDYNYSTESVFDTYPWPQAPTKGQVEAVAAAAVKVRDVRASALPVKGGLRGLYSSLALPGTNPLKDAHRVLDDAVIDAYGFSKRKDLLSQLLALNAEVANLITQQGSVIGPGIPSSYPTPSRLLSADCMG